jgi:hypothetical protein
LVHCMRKSPEVFTLTARDERNPDEEIVEMFWRSTYQDNADRLLEAERFIDRMCNRGFVVFYEEPRDE